MSEKAHTLPYTEIFAAGVHRGKRYTPRDLDDIVANFKRHSTGATPLLKVPGVIGHDEDDLSRSDLPAGGWGDDVRHVVRPLPRLRGKGRVAGEDGRGAQRCALCGGKGKRSILEQRFRDLSPELASALRRKTFDTVSAEIYDDPPEGIPGKGKMLRRVAFLGGEVPQVKGLKGPPAPESHAERAPGGIRLVRAVPFAPGRGGASCWACFSEVRKMAGTAHDPHTGQFTGEGARAAHAAAGKASKASGSGADDVSKSAHAATKAAVKSPSDESHRAAGAAHQTARKAHEEQASRWSGRSSDAAPGMVKLHKAAAEAHGNAAGEHYQAAQRIKPIYHAEDEGSDMDREAMIAELSKRGISADVLQEVKDEALAEWLRSLDGGAGEEEEDEDQGGDEPPPDKEGEDDDEDFDEEDADAEEYAEDGDPVDSDPEKMRDRALSRYASACKMMARYHGEQEESDPNKFSALPASQNAAMWAKVDSGGGHRHKSAGGKKGDYGGMKGKWPAKNQEGADGTTQAGDLATMKTVKLSEVAGIVRREVRKALKREVAGSLGELTKFKEETTVSQKKQAVDGIVARLCEQGKLAPSLKDHYADLLLAADARTVEKFSEKGKTVSLTRFDKIVRDLERLPTLFKETSRAGKAGRSTTGTGAAGTRKEWAEAAYQKFGEDLKATGVSRTSFIETAEKATDDQFDDLKREWDSLAN